MAPSTSFLSLSLPLPVQSSSFFSLQNNSDMLGIGEGNLTIVENNSSGMDTKKGILWEGESPDSGQDLPMYLWLTAFILLFVIFAVGTIGNTMVIIVIHCSRDMRTSTNIFLVNLSVADLLVLLICTPTCLIEVFYDPEMWLLGSAMCKLVPLLEQTVAHTSVLTILAISFERYYAICCPLQANYVCTKTRAISICLTAWFAAGIITSPMYFMTNYYIDGGNKAHCEVQAGAFWPDLYTMSSIILFFLLPFVILLITYGLIARKLTTDRCRLNKSDSSQNHRARKQVVLMLGTVVFTFFLCLLPFRILTMYVVLSDENAFTSHEIYYNLLYFCRIMLYINSALNPILYNIMSSKFRNGFLYLCTSRKRRLSRFQRQGTFYTMTTTTSTATTSNLPNNFVHTTSVGLPLDLGLDLEPTPGSGSSPEMREGDVIPYGGGQGGEGSSGQCQCCLCRKNYNTMDQFNYKQTYPATYSWDKKKNYNWYGQKTKNSFSSSTSALLSKDHRQRERGKGHCHYGKCRFYCSNKTYSRGINAENIVQKSFSLNCQRKGKKHIFQSRQNHLDFNAIQ